MTRPNLVSALVVLRPAGRRDLDGHEAITAESIDEFRADPADVALAVEHFRTAGFTVEAPGPIDVSITGEPDRFEEHFGTHLRFESTPVGVIVSVASGTGLPLDELPDDVRAVVQAVEFGTPPDFGPGAP